MTRQSLVPIQLPGDPVNFNEASNKNYVDNRTRSWRTSVWCATTTNITLSGTQTVDGISTSGLANNVLVKNQTTSSQNGIYFPAAGAWTRIAEASTASDLNAGTVVSVMFGETQAGKQFMQTLQLGTLSDPQAWISPLPTPQDRLPVRCASTANLSLTGAATVDGVAVVTGDRVLAKDQTSVPANGIYTANTAGAWTRASDANSVAALARGTKVYVTTGAQNLNKTFVQTATGLVTLGTNNVTWDVVTFLDLGTNAQLPTAMGSGQAYYSTDQRTIVVWDGAAWVNMGAPLICTSSTRPATATLADGFTIYESDTGKSYILQGGAFRPVVPDPAPLVQPRVDIYSTVGSTTWTKQAGALYVQAEVIGGGGSGGGATATASTEWAFGDGGGGGEYARATFAASALGSTEAITIGAGGSGTTGAGATGGTSSFGTAGTLVTALGGGGGAVRPNTTSLVFSNNGALRAGGTGGTGGQVRRPGGAGGGGLAITNSVASGRGGDGGASVFAGAVPGGSNTAGSAAANYGGGGSGAHRGGGQSAVTGGNGAGGLVIVTTYFG